MMDAIAGHAKDVSCTIKLGIGQGEYRCTAASIDELKNQALQQVPASVASSKWKEAKLVCEEDGTEVLDMAMLKEHLKKCHESFYLINSGMIPMERALNVDAVVDLFKAIAGLDRAELEMQALLQRDNLDVIIHVHPGHLASKLNLTFMDALLLKLTVGDALDETRKRFRLESNDPFSVDYGYDFENDEFH